MTQPLDAFKTALQFTLKWEGGFSPNDPNGAVNRGVTQVSYDTYRKRKGLALQSVKLITEAEVENLYYEDYWQPAKTNLMCLPMAIAHFDTAVNFSVRSSIFFLQEAIGGLSADGNFGPRTAAALEKNNNLETAKRYCQARMDYRYQRVKANPSHEQYLKGWLRRDKDLMKIISQLGEAPSAKSDANPPEKAIVVTPEPRSNSSGVSAENREKIHQKLEQAINLLQEIVVSLQQAK